MDDLTRIKGIGRTTAKKLAEAGITTFEQLAHDGLAGHHGIQADWIAQAADLLHENTKEKPPRSDSEPEAQLQDGAGLPADSGAGDPHSNTPKGASGTAREASSTDGGTTAETPDVGIQSAPPIRRQAQDGGGDGAPVLRQVQPGAASAPPAPDSPLDRAVHEQWPLLAASLERWKAVHGKGAGEPLVRISAKREGFRRCGQAHPKAATDHPFERFTPDQVERLLAEPKLTVELV